VVVLAAVDALDAERGERRMDWGPGVGGGVELALERNGKAYVSFYNRIRYLHAVSGAEAEHTILFSGVDVTIPITSDIAVGAYVSRDRRHSDYTGLPDDLRWYHEARVYFTWTVAHGTSGLSR